METNKMTLNCFKMLFILVGVIALSISSCIMHTDYRIGKAIENGSNPIDAQCAFSSNGLGNVCAMRATK